MNKLTKIVNEINGQDINVNWNRKSYKYNSRDIPDGAKNFIEENFFTKEIHLEDLLLSCSKNNKINVKFHHKKFDILLITYNLIKNGKLIDKINIPINLKASLSNQKTEVTNKLIEIFS